MMFVDNRQLKTEVVVLLTFVAFVVFLIIFFGMHIMYYCLSLCKFCQNNKYD